MANFYVKEGVGSLSFDGAIYNEGDLIEMTGKEAKALEHLVTKNKPSETEEKPKKTKVKAKETPETDTSENGDDTPETDANDKPEENTEGSEGAEDWSEETEIDLDTLDIEGLKALATEHEVKFVANIGLDTLKTRLVEHFSK